MSTAIEQLRQHEIPGRVTISEGNGGLPKISAKSDWATAEVYLHGAHVTGFQKNGEPPLLFMSQSSWFADGKPIRGGVPVIFPWFGPREGLPAHGTARIVEWELMGTSAEPRGTVRLQFRLPETGGAGDVEFVVTVTDKLAMELVVTNPSVQPLTFETCLHTYFSIGDVNTVSVTGLQDVEYLDKMAGAARKRETNDAIRIASEVDRVYLNTTSPTVIHDPTLRRRINVETGGSNSTVVWNPWINKSKAMPDFGDEEYHRMICVESGNVSENKPTLAPGRTSVLKVVISSQQS